MLVKLGNVWVDPCRVETILSDETEVKVTIQDRDNCEIVQTLDSDEEASAYCDRCAELVNRAIAGQSFGGDDVIQAD